MFGFCCTNADDAQKDLLFIGKNILRLLFKAQSLQIDQMLMTRLNSNTVLKKKAMEVVMISIQR